MPCENGEGSDDSTKCAPRSRPTRSSTTARRGPRRRERLVQAVVDASGGPARGRARRPGPAARSPGRRPGRPDRGQEVVGLHPLQVDGAPLARRSCAGATSARLRFQRQRAAEHRVGQHRLGQDLGAPWRSRASTGTRVEREAVLGAEREHDGVVVGGGLELEVEGDAEPLAQRQAERPVDRVRRRGRARSAAMPSLSSKTPLDDDALAGRQAPERGQPGARR